MANLKGLTLKKNDVSQVINLEEIFGVSFAGQKALRQAIAQKVIDHIVERTQSGVPVTGDGFKPYSKEYKESAEFKLLKDGSTVDMTLTGAMLNDIDLLSDSSNTIRVGFQDTTEKLKAFAHNTGYEGHPTIKNGPKRRFFGVTQEEVRKVVGEEFKDEIRKLRGEDPSRQTAQEIMDRGVLQTALEILNDPDFSFATIEDL